MLTAEPVDAVSVCSVHSEWKVIDLELWFAVKRLPWGESVKLKLARALVKVFKVMLEHVHTLESWCTSVDTASDVVGGIFPKHFKSHSQYSAGLHCPAIKWRNVPSTWYILASLLFLRIEVHQRRNILSWISHSSRSTTVTVRAFWLPSRQQRNVHSKRKSY